MENIYLLRRIVARRHAEDVGVQRHVRRRLQLPPVPARHPGVGDEEERGEERAQAQAPATAQHAVSGTRRQEGRAPLRASLSLAARPQQRS